MIERRDQPRVPTDIPVRIWGMDKSGARFTQEIRARNLSESGALLVEIQQPLRCGDWIGVQYEDRKARFKVIWIQDSESSLKIKAAVQKLRADECPWKHELSKSKAATVGE